MGRVAVVICVLIGSPLITGMGAGCSADHNGFGAPGSFSLGALPHERGAPMSNVQAKPYRLGAGDGLGREVHAQFVSQTASAPPPSDLSTAMLLGN